MKRLLIALLVLLTLCSCRENKNSTTGVKITDDLGKDFVFEKIPSKVISLAPSITETIYYLGADKNLIGVTKYCDYPPEAASKNIVGGLLDPNLELIAGLKPDLIFLTTEGNSKLTYKSLTDLGYSVFVLNPRKISDIVTTMEKLNSILQPDSGRIRIELFKTGVERYKVQPESALTYAAFLSVKPFVSFNDNTFIGDIFRISGFRNVFGEEKLDYPGIYDEDLIIKNPEYMFFFSDSSQVSIKNINTEISAGFGGLNAYRNGKFFILNENIFSRPGPRVVEALGILSRIRKKF